MEMSAHQVPEWGAESAPQRIPLVPSADGSGATPGGGGKAKKKEGRPAAAAAAAAGLLLAGKKFVLADYAPLHAPLDRETWRGFDVEADEYRRVAPTDLSLLELPLAFPPSYMRAPDTLPATPDAQPVPADGGVTPPAQPGPADPSQLRYGPKRCPSWCDRVMMDAAGLALVSGAAADATYDTQTWLPSYTDHSKVYLAFSVAGV